MAQLKTGIWVDALIRRAQAGGAFACVVQNGDRDAGSVLVTVRGRGGLVLYVPERDMQGERVWRAEAVAEEALAERIAARLDFDPDLMVVEIDDAQGRHFIAEAVLAISPAEPPQTEARHEPRADGADAAAAARALFQDR